MNRLILAATVGEWLEANIIALLVFIGSLIAIIFKIGRNTAKIDEMYEEMGEMEDTYKVSSRLLADHIADADKHVNHLYMQTVKERITKLDDRMDKMETTMSNGFEKMGNKLDGIARKQ
jgi:hypothetical protein